MTAWLSVSLWLLGPTNRKQHVNRIYVNMSTDSLLFYHSWQSAAGSVCHWGETVTTFSSSERTHEEETTAGLTDGSSFSLCDQRHSAASDLLSVSHAQERERASKHCFKWCWLLITAAGIPLMCVCVDSVTDLFTLIRSDCPYRKQPKMIEYQMSSETNTMSSSFSVFNINTGSSNTLHAL